MAQFSSNFLTYRPHTKTWIILGIFFMLNHNCKAQKSGETNTVWTEWDSWSPCDRTCGDGLKTRYRACFPIGAICDGPNKETEKCKLKPCSLEEHNWSKWSQWSQCSKSCGVGMQSRYRVCELNTTQCVGSGRQQRPCNVEPCPAAGGWSAWNEWSPCSERCGNGVRYQDRTCEDPPPSDGGRSCPGPGTRISHCFQRPCLDTEARTAIFNGNSYIEYQKTFVARKLFSAYIKFMPEEHNGLLLYRHHGNSTKNHRSDTITILLENSQVKLYVQYAQIQTWLTNRETLKMSKWHEVYAAVVGARIVLRVNNHIPTEEHHENIEMEYVDLDQMTFVGALSEAFSARTGLSYPGFVGQIANIRINYEDYFFDDVDEESINEETNHPLFVHNVLMSDLDTENLWPAFRGSDYTVFVCSKCKNVTTLRIELIVKPFVVTTGLIFSNFGDEPGSSVILYFRKNALMLCLDLGVGKVCTTTEPLMVEKWLDLSVEITGRQAKLRINRDHAYVLSTEGKAYRPSKNIHFAGGELEFWTVIYLITKLTQGFQGILYSLKTNGQEHDLQRDVALKETGRMVASSTASVAAKYDEYHETPYTEVEFLCDLSRHEEVLGVQGGVAFWLREGSVLQNFSNADMQKVPGLKHAIKLILHSSGVGVQDGLYGCLLRAGHHEFLVHVFGVSFDDANDIDFVEVAESAALVGALIASVIMLVVMFIVVRSGLLRRFPPYATLMKRMPSWFTDGNRKDFLRRHTASLQRLGTLPPDYIHRLLTQQGKAVQTPSVMDTQKLYGSQNVLGYNTDSDSDYDRPVPVRHSDGTLFPAPIINDYKRGTTRLKVPEHIRKNPDKYLPRKISSLKQMQSESFLKRNSTSSSSDNSKIDLSVKGKTDTTETSEDEKSSLLDTPQETKNGHTKSPLIESRRSSAKLQTSHTGESQKMEKASSEKTLSLRRRSKDAGTDTDQSLLESVFSKHDDDPVTVYSNPSHTEVLNKTTDRRPTTTETMSYPGTGPVNPIGFQGDYRGRAVSAGNVLPTFYTPMEYSARPVRYMQPGPPYRQSYSRPQFSQDPVLIHDQYSAHPIPGYAYDDNARDAQWNHYPQSAAAYEQPYYGTEQEFEDPDQPVYQ